MRLVRSTLTAAAVLIGLTAPARAGVLINFTGGATTDNQAPGQSFTTPAGGPYHDIKFNWYNESGPTAVGTLYILTSSYAGTPAALSSSTPGFVGASTSIVGNEYIFNTAVTLLGGTQYYAYTDSQMSYLRSVAGDGDLYTGGNRWRATSTGAAFASVAADAQFRLSGAAVPEPSTLVSAGAAVVGLVLLRRRRGNR